jgi:5-methylthioadenosine/S-adenosylhomocysteine deaminase
MMVPICIDGAFVVADGEPRVGAVLVEDGRISAIAWTDVDRTDLRGRAGDVVDGTGRWLMPGLIDAHAHAYGALLRGTENSLPLELWALYTTLYGRAFDGLALRAAILLAAGERIRAGITGTLDHSVMVSLASDSLAAHEASGLRVAFAPFLHDVSDYDLLDVKLPAALRPLVGGPPPLDIGAYAGNFAAMVQAARAGSGRVSVQLGPNAPQRCSPAAWALWRQLRDRHDQP